MTPDHETTFVCLPSVGRPGSDMQPLADALGSRAICPEPVTRAPVGATFEDIAEDAVSAAGSAERVVFVGHAYGGHVALAAGGLLGRRTAGVVVIGIGARSYPAELGTLIDRAADPSRDLSDRRDALATGFFDGPVPDTWLTGWSGELMAYQRAARRNIANPDLLKAAGAPVLDLIGANDPFRPPASHGDLRDVLGSRVRVEVIDGAKHALPEERLEDVTHAVCRWMADLAGLGTQAGMKEGQG